MSPFKDQLTDSDETLLSRFRETGSNFFIGELYKRYTHLVFGSCMKYLKDEESAKDMVMQVFEKLLTRLQTEQVDHFKSWLYIVTRNECLMHLRKAERTSTVRMNEENFSGVMENGSVEHLNEESREAILSALEKGVKLLNENQRVCIELFYLQEKSYQEVADLTGYTMNEVKSHIQNGKRNLRNFILKNDE